MRSIKSNETFGMRIEFSQCQRTSLTNSLHSSESAFKPSRFNKYMANLTSSELAGAAGISGIYSTATNQSMRDFAREVRVIEPCRRQAALAQERHSRPRTRTGS